MIRLFANHARIPPCVHGRLCATFMAGRVPAIHVSDFGCIQDVDARHKAGHDDRDSIKPAGRAGGSRSAFLLVQISRPKASSATSVRLENSIAISTGRSATKPNHVPILVTPVASSPTVGIIARTPVDIMFHAGHRRDVRVGFA
jgi:hypothetical protein